MQKLESHSGELVEFPAINGDNSQVAHRLLRRLIETDSYCGCTQLRFGCDDPSACDTNYMQSCVCVCAAMLVWVEEKQQYSWCIGKTAVISARNPVGEKFFCES